MCNRNFRKRGGAGEFVELLDWLSSAGLSCSFYKRHTSRACALQENIGKSKFEQEKSRTDLLLERVCPASRIYYILFSTYDFIESSFRFTL
jgi:hypothetical protein